MFVFYLYNLKNSGYFISFAEWHLIFPHLKIWSIYFLILSIVDFVMEWILYCNQRLNFVITSVSVHAYLRYLHINYFFCCFIQWSWILVKIPIIFTIQKLGLVYQLCIIKLYSEKNVHMLSRILTYTQRYMGTYLPKFI